MGGPHATFLPARTLREFPAFDAVARGEAEESLVGLLQQVQQGGGLHQMPGFTFRHGDEPVDTGIAPPPELDTLAPAAYDLLPMRRYRCPDSSAFSTLLATRGCPGRCVYCAVPAMFGGQMRYRSPRAVAQEMLTLQQRFGVRFLSFLDDTFTTRHDWVYQLCEHIRDLGLQRRLRWICLTRPDEVDEPLLRAMAAAGCVRVEMSIESGSAVGRAFLRKGLTARAVRRGFGAARRAGLSTMGFAMLNIPGEGPAEVEQTFQLVRRVDPDYLQLSFLTPYPGTPLWRQASQQGQITTTDWSRYSFLNHSVLRNDILSPAELQRQHARFSRRFWLRPRTAVKLGRLLLRRTTHLRPLLRTAALALPALRDGGRQP